MRPHWYPQEHLNSWTWRITNFNKLYGSHHEPFSIVCGRNKFRIRFECDGIRDCDNQALLYLFREPPSETDANVLWSVTLMNDQGEVCHSAEIPTSFKGNSRDDQPVTGGFYNVKCNFILDPVNGLTTDNEFQNIIIKCDITSLDDTQLENTGQRFRVLDLETLKDYQSLMGSSKFSDIVLVAGGVQFKLHKAILAARSPVFEAMFDNLDGAGKQHQIEIQHNVDPKVFTEMLKYVYGENVATFDQYAEELLELSDKFQLNSLKRACEQSLSQNLTIESVTKVFILADEHKAAELKSKCIDFINRNSAKVMATDGWIEMATTRVQLLMDLYRDVVEKLENK